MGKPRPANAWGAYNFGRLLATARTRRQVIADVEGLWMEPWPQIRQYVQIYKVTVTVKESSHG